MRWMVVTLTVGLGLLVGCEVQPCDRYVDYMCACHDGEPGVDCQELIDIYTNASADIQDQCSIDLADQEAEDQANGVACDTI
ncbi:MAG: hypothetical protein H6737_01335 [Alphaproteobacteria bacterium]|nr:hypothetical protein [Alphaproteobacteria bacterium]